MEVGIRLHNPFRPALSTGLDMIRDPNASSDANLQD